LSTSIVTLTHTLEVLDIPDQQQVDAFLPAFSFERRLDPANPISVGTLVAPEFFTETRHDHHQALLDSGDVILQARRDWQAITGRDSGGLLRVEGAQSADIGILTIGSIAGTLLEAMEGHSGKTAARLLTLRAFRPFPEQALREACQGLRQLVVLERALSPGAGGIVGTEVRAALASMENPPQVFNFAVGLGGRDVPLEIYAHLLEAIDEGRGAGFDILDLDTSKLPGEAS